jgi:hypothetical protein
MKRAPQGPDHPGLRVAALTAGRGLLDELAADQLVKPL